MNSLNDLKFSKIISENRRLAKGLEAIEAFQIKVLTNCTVNQLLPILEYQLRSNKVHAQIQIGDYDNIIQDSLRFKDANAVIIFWEIWNLINGFHYKIFTQEAPETRQIIEKTKQEIDLVLGQLKDVPIILFNKFSPLVFNAKAIRKNKLDEVCAELNEYLESKTSNNLILIDTEKIIASLGINNATDLRHFYASSALYNINFFKEYSQFIAPIFLSAKGKAKKAIIFDCDNTLWNGVVGEDGMEGIKMSENDKKGVMYQEVQHYAKFLSKEGILVGLCSKNNDYDVDEVIENHPDFYFKEEDITIKKVNWQDKASNLLEISQDLNIGKDSLVFVDDSDFEVNLVRERVPEVVTLQVPKNRSFYPQLVRNSFGYFFNISSTQEDKKKTQMYKNQAKRVAAKNQFENIDTYLASLELKVVIHHNNSEIIPRCAQMTQKTNQFNLTTIRYTEKDIEQFMNSDVHEVLAFNVADKYGDSGITGLCILKYEGKDAIIDTFLMSCRIIGRNIEKAFLDYLIQFLLKSKIEKLKCAYKKTIKNAQVSDFYDKLGANILNKNEENTNYEFVLNDYKKNNINYISITNIN